jgi:hypothetical protein
MKEKNSSGSCLVVNHRNASPRSYKGRALTTPGPGAVCKPWHQVSIGPEIGDGGSETDIREDAAAVVSEAVTGRAVGKLGLLDGGIAALVTRGHVPEKLLDIVRTCASNFDAFAFETDGRRRVPL